MARNRFKNHQGTLWLTVPVWKKGLGLQRINQVRIRREGRWARKHLESLKYAYGNAPYFKDHLCLVEEMFSLRHERLLDLNLEVIRYLMSALDIETEILLLSELGCDSSGTQLLVQICKEVGADCFLAQSPSRKYLDEDLFQAEGISLAYTAYPSPVYPQLWGDFIPNLSALDLLFNCGPKSKEVLRGKHSPKIP